MIVTDTPGVCDTNANAFAFAAAYLNKPFFQLDMPPVTGRTRSDEYHREDYKALIAFWKSRRGKSSIRTDSAKFSGRSQSRMRSSAELEDLARIVPNPLPVSFQPDGVRVAVPLLRHAGMHRRARIDAQDGARKRRERYFRLHGGVEKLRAFFCYIDHYTNNLQLWQMLDRNGICYQGNILSRSWAHNAPHVTEYRTGAGGVYHRYDGPGLDDQDSMADHQLAHAHDQVDPRAL